VPGTHHSRLARARLVEQLAVDDGGMRAPGDLQLLKCIAEIIFDGLIAQTERGGNLLVRLAIDNLLESGDPGGRFRKRNPPRVTSRGARARVLSHVNRRVLL
jgi:hypothetical protein